MTISNDSTGAKNDTTGVDNDTTDEGVSNDTSEAPAVPPERARLTHAAFTPGASVPDVGNAWFNWTMETGRLVLDGSELGVWGTPGDPTVAYTQNGLFGHFTDPDTWTAQTVNFGGPTWVTEGQFIGVQVFVGYRQQGTDPTELWGPTPVPTATANSAETIAWGHGATIEDVMKAQAGYDVAVIYELGRVALVCDPGGATCSQVGDWSTPGTLPPEPSPRQP